MKTKIYRSDTKIGLYIYLDSKKTLSDLPDELIKLIGKSTEVMNLDLTHRERLANENIETVKTNLQEKGYHVQLPLNFVNNVINYK